MRLGKRRLGALLVTALALAPLALTGRELLVSRSSYRANASVRTSPTPMPAPAASDRILVIAPHEDDETLGCAGLIQQAVAVGAQVHVVLMTNGEYPEVAVVLAEETLRLSPQAFERLGMTRQAETLRALELLGVPAARVTFLGYPDHGLEQMLLPEHWDPQHPVQGPRTRATHSPYPNSMTPGAAHCGAQALADLDTLLGRYQPNLVICPQAADIHPDHWATGALARCALSELAARGEGFARDCRLRSYLVHRDHWPAPRGFRPWLSLEPPSRLAQAPGLSWEALPLSLIETLTKRQATTLYRSQGGSFDRLLSSFSRANELFCGQAAQRWQTSTSGALALHVTDTATDLNSAALLPGGNITALSLERQGRRLRVSLDLRAPAQPRVAYHVALYASDGPVDTRLLAHYGWRAQRAVVAQTWQGGLHTQDPAGLRVSSVGRRTTLTVPWPFADAPPAFTLVRAWTTSGRHRVDLTPTAIVSSTQNGPTAGRR